MQSLVDVTEPVWDRGEFVIESDSGPTVVRAVYWTPSLIVGLATGLPCALGGIAAAIYFGSGPQQKVTLAIAILGIPIICLTTAMLLYAQYHRVGRIPLLVIDHNERKFMLPRIDYTVSFEECRSFSTHACWHDVGDTTQMATIVLLHTTADDSEIACGVFNRFGNRKPGCDLAERLALEIGIPVKHC